MPLLEHFFPFFNASTKQNSLAVLPLDRKSFRLPMFYFGFSTLLSRKIIPLLPPDHFHPWLREPCLETLSKCISEVLVLLHTHTLLRLLQEPNFQQKGVFQGKKKKKKVLYRCFPPDRRNFPNVCGPRRTLQEHSPGEDLGQHRENHAAIAWRGHLVTAGMPRRSDGLKPRSFLSSAPSAWEH